MCPAWLFSRSSIVVMFTPQRSPEAGASFREKIDAAAVAHGRQPGDVRILPGLAFVLGRTEDELAFFRDEKDFNRHLAAGSGAKVAAALQPVIDAHQAELDLRR